MKQIRKIKNVQKIFLICISLTLILSGITQATTMSNDEQTICGDANGNGKVDHSDLTYIIAYLYASGPEPIPLCSGDANGDGCVNIADLTYLLVYLYGGGAAPVPGCCDGESDGQKNVNLNFTMSIDDQTVDAGDTGVVIPVIGAWDRTISGFSIGLHFNSTGFTVVDVNFTGTIADGAFIQEYHEQRPGQLSIGVAWFPGNYMEAGSGVLAKIIFDVSGDTAPGDYLMDLGLFGGYPPVECSYADENCTALYPDLTDGTITVPSDEYDCGDVNDADGAIDIADLVYLVDYMFTGGPEPPIMCQADMNADGAIDIADLVYLVDYMFQGGPPPVEPCCPW